MARAYGQDFTAIVAARVTDQEKEQIKKAAARQGISISDFVRLALTTYIEKED